MLVERSNESQHVFMTEHGAFRRASSATSVGEGVAIFRNCLDMFVIDVDYTLAFFE